MNKHHWQIIKLELQNDSEYIKSLEKKIESLENENLLLKSKVNTFESGRIPSKYNLRTILANTFQYFVLFDLDKRVVDYNDSAQLISKSIFNQPLCKGLSAYEMMRGKSNERIDYVFSEVIKGKSVTAERSFVGPDGEIRWFEVDSIPVLNDEGTTVGLCQTAIETTISKKKENSLKETERIFKAMANSAPVMIAQTNVEGRFTFFNELWLEYTGTLGATQSGKDWMSKIHSDDRARFSKVYRRSFKLMKSFEMTISILRYDGEYRKVRFNGSPTYSSGNFFEGYILIGIDIHELLNTQEMLRSSEIKYRTLVENTDSGIVLYQNDRIVFCNESFCRITGYSHDQLMNRHKLELIYEEDRLAMMESHLQSDSGKIGSINCQYRLVSKDTSLKYVNSNCSAFEYNGASAELVFVSDMTKLSQLEREIKTIKDVISDMSEAFDQVFWTRNADSTSIDYINKSAESLYECDLDQLLLYPKQHLQAIHPDDKAKLEDHIQRQNNGEYSESEYRIIANNKIKWVKDRAFPIRGNSGKVYKYMGIIEEITSSKQLEIELLRTKDFLEHINIASPILIYIYDIVENRNIYSNRSVYEILGYSKSELGSMDGNLLEQLLHPEDQYIIKDIQVKFNELKDGDAISIKYRMLSKQGEWIWLEGKETVFERTIDGIPTKILGVVSNISEIIKWQDSELANQRILHELVENSNDGILMLDENMKIVIFNKGLEEITGYKSEEFIGKDFAEYFLAIVPDSMDDTERNSIKSMIDNLFTRPENDLYNKILEVQIKSKSGEIKKVQEINYLISIGQEQMVASIKRDVTELKLKDYEIERYQEELMKEIESKNKFLSILAHDLRSPISGFLNITKMITNDFEEMTIEEIAEVSSAMQNSADNLYKFMDDLLEWSQVQRGTIRISPEEFAIHECSSSILNINLHNLKYKNIEYVDRVQPNHRVLADKNTIHTILRNLISNAIKFSHTDSRIIVESQVVDGGAFIEVRVKDEGVGMSEEQIENLFDIGKLETRPGTMGEVGSGMGLILCKELINLNKGFLWVESQVNVGTIFSVKIPTMHIYY